VYKRSSNIKFYENSSNVRGVVLCGQTGRKTFRQTDRQTDMTIK